MDTLVRLSRHLVFMPAPALAENIFSLCAHIPELAFGYGMITGGSWSDINLYSEVCCLEHGGTGMQAHALHKTHCCRLPKI